ncbi:MAG: hypothetical protein QXS93_02680 [Candidatus Micrarchaeia archaeon]
MAAQDNIFKSTEADNWFVRNKDKLFIRTEDNDPIMKAIEIINIKPKKVIEIGAANGYRLSFINKSTTCDTE